MSAAQHRRIATALLLAGVFLLPAGCGILPGQQAGPPTLRPEPIDTPSGGRTATPQVVLETPAATAPSATPTEAVDLRLDAIHAEVEYVIPLHLQHTAPDSAVLFLELSQASPGRLFYWRGGDAALQDLEWVELAPGSTRHQIVLPALMRGETYWAAVGLLEPEGDYSVPGFLAAAWKPIRIRPAALDKNPLRVAVLGDSGFGQADTFQLANELVSFNPDLVLHTGDVVYRAFEEGSPPAAYGRKYYDAMRGLLHDLPIYPVLGNHELDAEVFWEGIPFYFWAFPPFPESGFADSSIDGRREFYAFAYGSTQFLMLNTQTFFGYPGREEQDAWLEARLADPRFELSVPVFHVAPFTSGLHENDGAALRSSWVPMFEAAGVPLVLSGHDHNYERLQVGDTTYVVTGGGSATLYGMRNRRPESIVFGRRTHFVLIDIFDDRLELTAIALGGDELDRATIRLGQ